MGFPLTRGAPITATLRFGWQHEAASRVEHHHRDRVLFPLLSDHEKALVCVESGASTWCSLVPVHFLSHIFNFLLKKKKPPSYFCRDQELTCLQGPFAPHSEPAKRASKVGFRTCRGSCTSGRVAGQSSRCCPPTVPAEPQNLAVEVRLMQGVIDCLLRERAQMRVDAGSWLATRIVCQVARWPSSTRVGPSTVAGSGSVV